MHIDLVFPPAHDPAMPHSALPLLKAYVERNSDHTVACHDVNQRFFTESVLGADAQESLTAHRCDFLAADDVVSAVLSAMQFDAWVKEGCSGWAGRNEGYNLTFRNLHTPFDRRDPRSVREFARSDSTPFDSLFADTVEGISPVVGINLSVEDQILPAFRLAWWIRKIHGRASSIIWGGSLLARIYPVIRSELSEFWDYLITREGEVPLLSLLGALEAGEEAPWDDRIVSKSSTAEYSIETPYVSKSITPIAQTGGAIFADYQVDNYLSLVPMLPVLASRKCYWGKCSFCTIHESWDPLARQRSAQSVAAEMEHQTAAHGIRHFRFVDEAMPPELLNDLLPLVESRSVAFEIYAIAERRFRDVGFVERLGRAGCRQAYFGLESADEGALISLGKRINQHRNFTEIFGSCAAAGIHVYTYTLFGFPGSSELAEQRTVEFISTETAVQSATISSFVPVTGSPFAADNGAYLTHSQRMTEDYEQVSVGLKRQDLAERAHDAAAAAVHEVYRVRPDLALTAMLNDEIRFSLSDRFGSDFAIKAIGSGRLDLDSIIRTGDITMTNERISRSLD
jgi:radical SAM superfamily enzyme YgiQ (UPF0313 family)